jgi:hypothetical protein
VIALATVGAPKSAVPDDVRHLEHGSPEPLGKSPFRRLSRKLMTANPTIWAAQPAVAAPAAIPERPRMIPIAAELIGRVRKSPIATLITIPIQNGCNSVA